MGFELKVVNDSWEVVLFDESDYIHALKMAPEAIESNLKSGKWLVVAFPVWSVPVRHSVRAAMAYAKQQAGKVSLGIRPYDDHEEMSKWWPVADVPVESETTVTEMNDGQRLEIHIATDGAAHPLWLILKDGRVVYQGTGSRSEVELESLMNNYWSD